MAGKPNTVTARTRRRRPAPERCLRRLAAPKLDRLIHERLRLGILSALSVNESLTFNELKKLLDTTDGNLSVHARKLEEAGYVACTKSFEGRMPRTEYRLTAAGRRALERYLDHMEALDPGHARPVESLFFMPDNFTSQSTLHVGIIMDGNGRWALGRGLPRVAGPSRRRGDRHAAIVEAAPGAGIGILTLFAFSSRQLAAPARGSRTR